KFRGVQTLVVDDIQFLAEKRRSQEEFAHTFNALHESARQIVIASDRAPHDLPGIGEALRYRFASGLLAHVRPPDAALRRALVERKASGLGVSLTPEVASYLAEEWCANVRELEGALTRVEAYASLSGRSVDLALVREALGPSPVARRGPTLQRIIGEVCQHYQVARDELSGPRRTARLAVPRHLAMYLCRQHTDVPLARIGAELGGRDHSTVVHALGAIERRLEKDATLREAVSLLRARLGARRRARRGGGARAARRAGRRSGASRRAARGRHRARGRRPPPRAPPCARRAPRRPRPRPGGAARAEARRGPRRGRQAPAPARARRRWPAAVGRGRPGRPRGAPPRRRGSPDPRAPRRGAPGAA